MQQDSPVNLTTEDNLRAALLESQARNKESSFRAQQGNKNIEDALHAQDVDHQLEEIAKNLAIALKRIDALEEERRHAVKWAIGVLCLAVVGMAGFIFNIVWAGKK